jgi:hypothetical protein
MDAIKSPQFNDSIQLDSRAVAGLGCENISVAISISESGHLKSMVSGAVYSEPKQLVSAAFLMLD